MPQAHGFLIIEVRRTQFPKSPSLLLPVTSPGVLKTTPRVTNWLGWLAELPESHFDSHDSSLQLRHENQPWEVMHRAESRKVPRTELSVALSQWCHGQHRSLGNNVLQYAWSIAKQGNSLKPWCPNSLLGLHGGWLQSLASAQVKLITTWLKDSP